MKNACKICGGTDLALFAHTAKCANCGVLLYWPYPAEVVDELADRKQWARNWYGAAAPRNHENFTDMLRYAVGDELPNSPDILDYGGGGGQFALVCKSHMPSCSVYITDLRDAFLLDEWAPMNTQIPFADFPADSRTFDFIFMNDVFEHVADPVGVLETLARKLKPNGRIFIDTPRQFWLYPVTKAISTPVHTKLLRGTVSVHHLQIWSRKAFDLVVAKAGLRVAKYDQVSEYTLPPEMYLSGMEIRNPLLRMVGHLFYSNAKWLAANKMLAVLTLNESRALAPAPCR